MTVTGSSLRSLDEVRDFAKTRLGLEWPTYMALSRLEAAHMRPYIFLRAATESYQGAGPRFEVSHEEAIRAICELFSLRMIQYVDARSRARFEAMRLKSDVTHVPTNGWPHVGDVDVTQRGARIIKAMWRFRYGRRLPFHADRTCEDGCTARVFAFRREDVVRFIEAYFPEWERVLSYTEPRPVGPWYERWWLRWPRGWMSEVALEVLPVDE